MNSRLERLLAEAWQFRFYRNDLGTITIEGTPSEVFIDRNHEYLSAIQETAAQRYMSDGSSPKRAIRNLMDKLECQNEV